MTVISPAIGVQAGSHPAQNFRQLVSALGGAPVQTFAGGIQATTGGGAHGVTYGLAVVENGTPNMSVDVGAGTALITGSSSLAQGVYAFTNDATVNLSIAESDATNPRKDLICAQVRDDAEDGGGNNDARLHVITGTPAGSPSDPAVEAGDLVVARVNVPATDTTITNSQIDDLRMWATALGGIHVCTSTTRPSGASLRTGMFIFETGTGRVYRYNGTTWILQGGSADPSYASGTSAGTTSAGGDLTITYGVTFTSQPRLIATPRLGTNNQLSCITPSAPGTTSATLRFTLNDALHASSAVTVDWIALGTVAV